MIPDHIATLAIILLAFWLLYRWGAPLFTILAFVHFCRGEWDLALHSCAYAGFITLVRALVSWLNWNVSGRSVWLRERFRSFPQ